MVPFSYLSGWNDMKRSLSFGFIMLSVYVVGMIILNIIQFL